HPAAEVAAVCDDDVVHPCAPALVVDGELDLGVAPAGEDRERRPEVGQLAAEGLARLVRALGDGAAHAGAPDVREIRLTLAAFPRSEPDAARIELANLPLQRDAQRVVQPTRDAVRPHEVPPGAAGDDRELDAVAARDPVHDLV